LRRLGREHEELTEGREDQAQQAQRPRAFFEECSGGAGEYGDETSGGVDSGHEKGHAQRADVTGRATAAQSLSSSAKNKLASGATAGPLANCSGGPIR
jgi:hypothetical protein